MTIRVYRDNDAGSVVFEPSTISTQFTNSLQAIENDDGLIDIFNLHGPTNRKEVSDAPYTEFEKQDGSPAGATVVETVNYLNSQFDALAGGGPGGLKPTITSSLNESVVAGSPFNYQITATNDPIYFDASGLPTGLSVNHEFGTIFGSTTVVGASVVPISAVNANGTTTANLSLTVTAAGPGFVDTKSVRFRGPLFRQYLSIATTAAIERTSAQAWSISQWVYIEDLEDSDLYSFGSTNDHIAIELTSGGAVVVRFKTSSSTALEIEAGSLAADTWYHVVVTNDGTETPGGITVYVDGAAQVNTVNQNNMSGSAGGSGDMRVGRASGGIPQSDWFDGYVNEWAFYKIELTAGNVTTLYNGGTPTDLNAEAFVGDMVAWIRMGDGDTYPTLTDNEAGGSHDATMVNMTVLNIVSFTP